MKDELSDYYLAEIGSECLGTWLFETLNSNCPNISLAAFKKTKQNVFSFPFSRSKTTALLNQLLEKNIKERDRFCKFRMVSLTETNEF